MENWYNPRIRVRSRIPPSPTPHPCPSVSLSLSPTLGSPQGSPPFSSPVSSSPQNVALRLRIQLLPFCLFVLMIMIMNNALKICNSSGSVTFEFIIYGSFLPFNCKKQLHAIQNKNKNKNKKINKQTNKKIKYSQNKSSQQTHQASFRKCNSSTRWKVRRKKNKKSQILLNWNHKEKSEIKPHMSGRRVDTSKKLKKSVGWTKEARVVHWTP